MQLQDLLFDVSDGVATITLNRPDMRNALSEGMREGLDQIIAHVKEDAGKEIKAVLITGAGRHFCAGGDIKAMQERAGVTPEQTRRRMRRAHNRLFDLANLEVPVIAAVNGFAAGAGFSFALLADFILASPRTRFANSFVRIGYVPDWAGLYFLPRIVGLQKAKELVFSCRQFDASEAKKLGIVHAILPEETFMEEARAFAGRFRDASPSAVGIAKNALIQSFNQDHRTMLEIEAFSQAVSYGTDYHREAVNRFVTKEPPRFNWEAFEARAAE
jgi:2-(1,2-epoxy-1,2-dihydrophenyl)acetyl-CoA isomerase